MSVQMLEEPNNLPRLVNSKRISRSLSRPDIRCSADVGHHQRADYPFPSFMSTLGASRWLQNTEHRDGCSGTRTVTATAPQIPERSRTITDAAARSSSSSRARLYGDSTKTSMSPAVTNNATSIRSGAPDPTRQHFHATNSPSVEYQSGSGHFCRGSSSVASESTDSSPTTASSTFDSPLIADQSPGSSPESPSSVNPLSSVKPTAHCVNGDTQPHPLPPSDTLLSPARPESPRKGRNLKNLSLKLASPSKQSHPSLSTAPAAERPRNISAPSSPVAPVSKPSRRRQPNLTIQTPVLGRSSTDIGRVIPPTPSSKPTLRHFESSPSLNSVQSPTCPTFPAFPSHLQSAQQADVDDSNRRAPASLSSSRPAFSRNEPLQALGEEDDYPISTESCQGNDKGYPDGPLLIYDSGLYLYAEPNRDEASNFDVVFNVAKEIANPFQQQSVQQSVTATPCVMKAEPEYIHVPWDHNSEILDDLYTLCEMIDERISKGKSVLIHCQLGVSRSASLVIAYGLYKNPELDFNSIYSIVKGRSCWVGPNMSLIYQLTDFRSRVRQGYPSKPPPEEWFRTTSCSLSSQQLRKPDEALWSSSRPEPAATEQDQQLPLPPAILSPSPLQEGTSGETSSFPPQTLSARPGAPTGPRRNMPCRPLPLREKYQTIHTLRSSRPVDGMSLCERLFSKPPKQINSTKHDETTPSESIFSPTNGPGFPDAPFSRTSAGDLALPRDSIDSSSRTEIQTPMVADPRSPQQQRKEPLIMRSIDEFL